MLIRNKDYKEQNDLDKVKSKYVNDKKMQDFLDKYKPIQSTEKLIIEYYNKKGIEANNIPLYPLQRALSRVNEINKTKGFDYDR